MSDTVPYLFSHNKSSFPDARFISATEVMELRRNENKLEFYLNSFDNNAWTAQRVATVECSNCSSSNWHANNNMIALTSNLVFNPNGPGMQSRVWLMGRQDSGDWNSIEIENIGQTGLHDARIELLDNRAAVYLRSDFDSDTTTRAFLFNPNNGWSELALENLPEYFLDERNTAFHNYTGPSGTWQNFVVYSEGNGDVEYHTTDDGVRQIINIAPPGAEPQDSIQNAEVFENTLLINAATQDGDYPNQGAVHFYGRDNNTWRYEFTVWKITSDRSNASLLSESVALIGNRIFERQFDQTWVQTAGINSDGGIRTIFLEGNTIGWRDDLFFQLASWGPAPGCENIGPSGLGNFQQSACTLEEQPQATPIDGLSSTLDSGSFEPFTSTAINESLRFVSVERDGIELYEFDESERNLTKRVFSACERIAPQSTDCFHTDGFVDGNTIVATSHGPSPNRHRLFFITVDDESTSEEAVWQELSIPDSELSSNGTFVDGLALEDSLGVFSATGPGLPLYVISESQSGQWLISTSVSTTELKIRSRLDTSIDNGRIAITSGSPDTDDKVQLFRVSATGDLFYETTIKPANIPSTNYKSLDLHGDALLVGGTLFYASFLEQFTDLASGTARLFERDESGEWVETGQFQSSNAQERSYGQQVFLSDGFAVVMALREVELESTPGIDYSPNYNFYQKQANGIWTLLRQIEHNLVFGCPDCDVVNDVRFPAQLIDNYFFLAANGGYDVYDLATNTQVFSGVSGPIASESSINSPLQDQPLETTDEAEVSAPTDAITVSPGQAGSIDINPVLETADNAEIPAQTDITNVNPDSDISSSGGGVISIFMFMLLLTNRRVRGHPIP